MINSSLPQLGSRRRPRASAASGRAATATATATGTGTSTGMAQHWQRWSAAVLIASAVALNAAVCVAAAQLNVIVIGAGTALSLIHNENAKLRRVQFVPTGSAVLSPSKEDH